MRQRLAGGLGVALTLCACGHAGAQEIGRPGAASLYGAAAEDVASLPTDAEVAAAAPPKRSEGSAALHCTAGPSGLLEGCTVMLQRNPGFGAALMSLAPKFRLKPAEGRPATDVVISASWPVVDHQVDWQVPPKDGDFATTSTPAAWKYGKPGAAVMNCLVGRLGATYDCMVTLQEPRGVGMGTMVLRFAHYFKLKPAMVAGKPVPAAVNFPFRMTPSSGRIY